MDTGRLEAFSDGVLAIVITIMVLGLSVPTGDTFAELFASSGTSMLAYLLSFVYVGIYWNNHHHLLRLAPRVDGAVLWANLGLLFFISFLPFTTAWMAATEFARDPVVLYGVELFAVAIAYLVLQWALIRAAGRDSELRAAIGRDWKGRASLALYAVGIVAAFLLAGIGEWVALAAFVIVAVIWVIPDRRLERST